MLRYKYIHIYIYILPALFIIRTNLIQNVAEIPKNFQQDDTLVQYFIISCKSLYMFRVKHSPVIRSSIKLYLQHLVLTNSGGPAVVVVESKSSLLLVRVFWVLYVFHFIGG
jgi:hypothetical protein